MAIPIKVAKLGWGTEPIELVEWKAAEGNLVKQGDIVLVVSVGKITADVEAEASGYLHILLPEESEAAIGSTIGLIAKSKEELERLQKEQPGVAAVTAETRVIPHPEPSAPAPATPPSREQRRLRISPVARKMAEEHMIDVTAIAGTGPEGRIIRKDIEKIIAERRETAVSADVYRFRKVKSVINLKGMRKVIAEHMHRSLAVSAQLTAFGEIDMAETMKLRDNLPAQAETTGGRITYTDIFVLAVARILKRHPIINSSLIDNEIKLWESLNIGVAVALEEGLIVPVVKDADKKSLVEISSSITRLVQKSRENKLTPDDVSGGTFTISNLGALGGGYRFETVIINQPESAILGTGGITDRVVARDGQIVIRPIMTYYFTYDHRVINGAQAASFMADVTRLLEAPGSLLS